MPTSEQTMQWLSILLQTAPGVVMQLIEYLRSRGHEETATDIEAHLSRSDENLRLVIARSREARGLPPLP